jgi:K(+)-stimulated pyrophosphate-energized sodium pump
MTELALVLAFAVLGLVFAAATARALLGRAAEPELAELARLIAGGARRYLGRQSRVALAVAAALGATVLLAYGVAYQTDAVRAVPAREFGAWVTGGYLAGAAVALSAGTLGGWVGGAGAARVASGACRSLDEALQAALRTGAVTGLGASALATLATALFVGAAELFAGWLDRGDETARLARIPPLLSGFALGVAIVALVARLGGGTFAKVADIGADVGPVGAPNGGRDAARVADLVGDTVCDASAGASSTLACGAAESLGAMLVAAAVYRDNAALASASAIILFPLVARTLGLLASGFGVLVVRTDGSEVPMNALARGLYVATLLYVAGAAGAARWLLGAHWLPLAAAAALGAAGSLSTFFVVQYLSEARHRPVRALVEAARAGPTLSTLRGLLTGAEGALALVLIGASVAAGAYALGSASGLAGGGLFGLAVGVGGLMGAAPYAMALDAVGSVADNAGGLVEMTLGDERPDVRARTRLFDAVGTTVKAYVRALVGLASALGCVVLIVVFAAEVHEARQAQVDVFEAASPAPYLGALTGLAVLVAFGRVVLGRIVSAGRDLVHELRSDGRHGHGASRELACVEAVSRVALGGMVPPVVLGVGVPLALGAGLRLVAPRDGMAEVADALVALLLVATLAGVFSALLFTHAAGAWDSAKKHIEAGALGGRTTPADNPAHAAAVVSDTIGDPLAGAVGPATVALCATLTALGLVFLPFFL